MSRARSLALLLPFLGACYADYNAMGEFGATQGGVQDMGLAREMIASGFVPPPEAFVVEGMFSEHELGLEGEPCSSLLCLRAAAGEAPDADGLAAGFVQVGMSSTIDPDTFERPSVTMIAVVDVSGSMGWTYEEISEEYASPGQISRYLLQEIADELGPQDRIAIVTYGSRIQTALDFTDPTDPEVDQAIGALNEGGSTNMEGGLERAYELARAAEFDTDQVRLALFTDVQPNVGATGPGAFQSMVASGADDDIGLTVFGMGVGLGQELMTAISHLRGGNAFSLFDLDDTHTLMEDSWPWMVSPIAYDLRVEMDAPEGFTLSQAYGFPTAGNGDPEATLDIATVFLSRRKGAMLLELTPEAYEVGAFDMGGYITYTTPEGAPIVADVIASHDGVVDERGQGWEQHSVGKTTALALLVEGMKQAATEYGPDPAVAVETMTEVHGRFAGDAESLDDVALPPEVELAAALLELMENGAPQETSLYGY